MSRSKLPKTVILKSSRTLADFETYKICMTIIKARIFTIQRLLTDDISYKYYVFKVEAIYLQFRLLIEMLYLSVIVIKNKKHKIEWPKSTNEYNAHKIRKYFKNDLSEEFPFPFQVIKDKDGNATINFLERPIQEEEIYIFFNKCHQYLHEPNPYKKDFESREKECGVLIKEAEDKLLKIIELLESHARISELDDGEKFPIICFMGDSEEKEVIIQSAFTK